MNEYNDTENLRVPEHWGLYLTCFLGIPTLALLCGKVWKLSILMDGWPGLASIYAVLRWECLLCLILALLLSVCVQYKRWQALIQGGLVITGSLLWIVTCWEHLCYLRWGSLGDAVFLWHKARSWLAQSWDILFPDYPTVLRWFWLVPIVWLGLPMMLVWIRTLLKHDEIFGSVGTADVSAKDTQTEQHKASADPSRETASEHGVYPTSWLWRGGVLWLVLILVLPPVSPQPSQQGPLMSCLWPVLFAQGLYHRFVSSDRDGEISSGDAQSSGQNPPSTSSSPPLFSQTQNKPAAVFDTRYTQLLHTSVPIHRNVVLVLVDTMRMRATTLFQPDLATTPSLARLAKEGIWVKDMYGVTPDPIRSMIAVLCGIYPRLASPSQSWHLARNAPSLRPESLSRSPSMRGSQIPARCLPHLLHAAGYQTAFFHGASAYQQEWIELLSALGFGQLFGWQDMSTQGFVKIHRDIYEDRVMLEPAFAWMEHVSQQGQSFFVTLFLQGSHPESRLPPGTPQQQFPGYAGQEPRSYLQALRDQDQTVEQILQELQRRDWMKSTIFAVVGLRATSPLLSRQTNDGQALEAQHMHVPAVFYAPGVLSPAAVQGLRQHVDIVPSLLSWLNFSALGAIWSGTALTTPPAPQRILWMTGSFYRRCSSLLREQVQFVFHHYHKASAWLSPKHQGSPTAKSHAHRSTRTNERAVLLREDRVQSVYEEHDREILRSARTKYTPHVVYPSGAMLGSHVRVVGAILLSRQVKSSGVFSVSVVFQALRPIHPKWQLFFSLQQKSTGNEITIAHNPVHGLWPLSCWLTDEFVIDSFLLRVPAGYQNGDVLRLYVGMSSTRQERLPVSFPLDPSPSPDKQHNKPHPNHPRVLLMEFSLSM